MNKRQTKERWLPCAGYEDQYAISTHGRVMRTAGGRGATPGYILKSSLDGVGYPFVVLGYKENRKPRDIHVLMLETFVCTRPQGLECHHKDGNKQNNHLDNLEWVTKSQNALHAHRTGLSGACRGEDHPNSKLTEDDVRVIRALPAFPHGPSTHTLAKQYNTSPTCIHDVLKRRTWKHIPGLSDGHWSRDCHG